METAEEIQARRERWGRRKTIEGHWGRQIDSQREEYLHQRQARKTQLGREAREMGRMKELDIEIENALANLALEKEANQIGGRRRLEMETLLRTEQLVGELGARAAAEKENVCYHAIRYRMRRLYTMRGERGIKKGNLHD